MNIPTQALLAFCILPLCGGGVAAQEDKWGGKPIDFKVLVPPLPPVVPLPRDYQLKPGAVGGTQTPSSIAPLENPAAPGTQASPGIRLSIPTR